MSRHVYCAQCQRRIALATKGQRMRWHRPQTAPGNTVPEPYCPEVLRWREEPGGPITEREP